MYVCYFMKERTVYVNYFMKERTVCIPLNEGKEYMYTAK